jgi:CDP-glucose 4,6-dehydratase
MENMGVEKLLRKYYFGKKVLVTGHTGFKGSWLISVLKHLGANVTGYSLKAEKTSLYNLIEGDKLCDSIIGNIEDTRKLEGIMKKVKPDFIFHLAAQSLVRVSYEEPVHTFGVNAMGTLHLLNAVNKLNSKCSVLAITTDKVYENQEKEASFKEDYPLGGYDPYSASKACAELIVSSYRKSYWDIENYKNHKKSVATVRAGNIIGGGDWAKDRIIPDIVKALLKKETVIIRSPNSTRPWQHVLDGITGYLLLSAKLSMKPNKYSGAWNFGPASSDKKSVIQLTESAIELWGCGSYEVIEPRDGKHEAKYLQLDSSKARKQLHWKPCFNSSTGLQNTIEWYRQVYLDGLKPRQVTFNQIKEYYNS